MGRVALEALVASSVAGAAAYIALQVVGSRPGADPGRLMLLVEGLQAKASSGTMTRMLAYILADNFSDMIPIPFAGSIIDMVFPGHLMAANALQKDIEDRYGAPEGVPQKKWQRKKPKLAAAHR